MAEGVLNAIAELVDCIYTPDKKGLSERYLALIDEMILFLKRMEENGYSVDITRELEMLQKVYASKDYVWLSDILLYEIKPEFEQITG